MDKKSKLLYDAILLLGIVLFGYAGVKLYERYADLAASRHLYEELNEEYAWEPEGLIQVYAEDPEEQIQVYAEGLEGSALLSEDDSSHGSDALGEEASEVKKPEIREIPWYRRIRVNFERLKERNPEVVGWIFFENESISYPILYSGDNTKYLQKSLDGKRASAGSIFMDGGNTPDFEDSRTVVYGHNMKDLSMFGKLKYYREKDYYEEHQYFQILVEGTVYRYRIFSCFEVSETETEICRVNFTSENDFADLIDELQNRSIRSVRDTGIEVDKDDKVVTLLTCYTTGNRTLVSAVRVDSYDTEAVEQDSQTEYTNLQ